MPLSTSKIPNLPLTGPELKTYAAAILHAELETRSVPDEIIAQVVDGFSAAMSNDFLFLPCTSYPNVRVELKVRLHFKGDKCEYSLQPRVFTTNPLDKEHPVFVRVSALLEDREGATTEAFTMSATVDNPNLVRVHYGIPIVLSRRKDPEPGQIFAEVVNEVLEYNPADFELPTPPTVKDETEEVAAAYNSKPSTATPSKPSTAPGGRQKGWNKTR